MISAKPRNLNQEEPLDLISYEGRDAAYAHHHYTGNDAKG